ncbi:MAG: methionine--tRNA ligase [Chloroflexi bacterium]|nr:methionine--tRNA ligase [Chloroflexota bacterium]
MAEKIFIGVAWPYTNGYLHLGHLAGCYVAADIFARYHRLKGNRVLMVSGSDQHGTPITITAEEEGITPQEVVDKYRKSQLEVWDRLGISFDLFTTTGTANHREVVHDLFLVLLKKGLLYTATTPLPYCPKDRRFLPDRYVEGTCPFCGNPGARGDQCDQCGKPMNPVDLRDLRCRLCGTAPEIRGSEHFFLKLSALRDQVLAWVRQNRHWRPTVLNFTLRYLEEGLHDRAITRDIDWGVAVPLSGYVDKRIYVWFEAVIGYLSASKEWARLQGQPEAWREFWQDTTARSYYFLGKDNIPFHTIIWPAMLLGYGGLNLPYDVPANEFMNLGGGKFSKSQHRAVWVPDYLERYEPDPLRYYMAANMPETSDTEFTWEEFVRRNNDELVATYGNLVHRVLTMVQRNFAGTVPEPAGLDEQDLALLHQAERAPEEVGGHLGLCNFRQALGTAMALAQAANRYLDFKAPWRTLRQDRLRTGTTLWVALVAISALKTVTAPFLPFSAQALHRFLGLPGSVEDAGWSLKRPVSGSPLPEPKALFTKLDDSLAEAENARLVVQAR